MTTKQTARAPGATVNPFTARASVLPALNAAIDGLLTADGGELRRAFEVSIAPVLKENREATAAVAALELRAFREAAAAKGSHYTAAGNRLVAGSPELTKIETELAVARTAQREAGRKLLGARERDELERRVSLKASWLAAVRDIVGPALSQITSGPEMKRAVVEAVRRAEGALCGCVDTAVELRKRPPAAQDAGAPDAGVIAARLAIYLWLRRRWETQCLDDGEPLRWAMSASVAIAALSECHAWISGGVPTHFID